jgi:hypothetical protein
MLAALIVLAIGTGPSWAVEFAGGTGEPNDPYLIATAEHLTAIGLDPNLLDKHYLLVADIDLDPNLSAEYAFDEPVIGGFRPGEVGTYSFTGSFDGNGFAIRHLTIRSTPGHDYAGEGLGLFYEIGTTGRVWNLAVEEAEISAGSTSFVATVLCVANKGEITRCSVTGIVTAEGSAAGLIGSNEGSVSCCLAGGIVSANGTAGGLVASNDAKGIIEDCSSTAVVSGSSAGGLVGRNLGDVRNCYAAGEAYGEYVGGLVERHEGGLLSDCYAACAVDRAGDRHGGLARIRWPEAVVDRCYFVSGPDNGIGTLLTGDQVNDPSSFVGWDFWGLGNNGFGVAWFMPAEGLPQLTWSALASIPDVHGLPLKEAGQMLLGADVSIEGITFDFDPAIPFGLVSLLRPYAGLAPGEAVDLVISLGEYDWTTSEGTGDVFDPYLILSAGQLDCLAHQPHLWGDCFKLVADLDTSWRFWDRPLLGYNGTNGAAFEGTFDGGGHVVGNLALEVASAGADEPEVLGFFGEIGPSGSVTNLGLRGVAIEARAYKEAVGGMLCAINNGYIGRCYGVGAIKSRGWLGGLVGSNTGTIQDSYAQGQIEYTGRGTKTDFDELYAGLVAENIAGTIDTCYAACSIRWYRPAGLVGYNAGGSVENSLWDVEVSGTEDSDGGIGLSTRDLMDLTVLQSHAWGGNFNWIIDQGKDYPRLVWEGTPGSFIPMSRP